MKDANYWIDHLNLASHPEGGYFKETYRSDEIIDGNNLPARFGGGARNYSTAIYYLIESSKNSKLHKIKSDELWHFYHGEPLDIFILDPNSARFEVLTLGSNMEEGQHLQLVVPKNCWFGAKVKSEEGYALVGCTVAPGFDFLDFELADRNILINTYPQLKQEISALT